MRRPTLSTKLIAAALPLVVAVVALLALTVRSDLNQVNRAESGAELGAVWDPLITALTAIEAESGEAVSADSGGVSTAATRRATDQAVNDLRDDIESLGAAQAAGSHVTASRSSLSAARRNLDMASIAPDLQTEVDPFEAYDLASRELVAVGQLLPSEAGDPELGRQLLAVVKLAEAKLSADDIISGTQQWQASPSDTAPLATALGLFQALSAVGNIAGSFIARFLVSPDLKTNLFGLLGDHDVSGWRILFMIGVLPAILVVFVMPAWWRSPMATVCGTVKLTVNAVVMPSAAQSSNTSRPAAVAGSLTAMFGAHWWNRRAIGSMTSRSP